MEWLIPIDGMKADIIRKDKERERHMPAGICEVVRENHGSKFAGRSRDDSTKMAKFWKKSLNGQATVVGGHATVGWLWNNVFSTFQAIRKILGNCRWTVTRQWSEVTRLSADYQTTFFRRFKQFGKLLKKVAERTRDSGGRSRDRRMTVKQRFLTFQAIQEIFKKIAQRSRDSGRRSSDRWPTVKQCFFDVSSISDKFLKKMLIGHATVVGGHATVGRLSNNVLSTIQAIRRNFEKKLLNGHETVVGGSRDRRPTVKQRFFDVSSNSDKFWRKSLKGHVTVVGGHATVGQLSNNVFSTFQTIQKNFEKSRWTVTRQWSDVTRPLADCQTTFFRRFKQIGKFLKKVAERSRDSGQRSRDRWPTVKQRFFDVSNNSENFWKKSLDGHAAVVGGHATVSADCQTTFFRCFKQFRNFSEKSRWTVKRQWSEVTRLSSDCQTTFFLRFKQFGRILKKVAERSRDKGRRSRDRWPTVNQRFFDVSNNSEKFWKKSPNGHATVVGGHA